MTGKYKYVFLKTFVLSKLSLFTMFLKICTKNFCPDECALLVDLVQENRQKLFGAFIYPLTSEEKNIVCGDMEQQL